MNNVKLNYDPNLTNQGSITPPPKSNLKTITSNSTITSTKIAETGSFNKPPS